jgi:ribokinase
MSQNQPAVIAVVGSAMMDLTAYAKVLPEPGQTLVGQIFTTGFGGKGANQAVMAALCGAPVHFIGKLGKDVFGDAIAENFNSVGMNVSYVDRSDTPTGVAHIWVDGEGENRIIIIPGANHEIEVSRAVDAINNIPGLNIVIAQCEIKQEVTVAAFKAAKSRGCTTILNPAPFEVLSQELIDLCDWIIPNETEFRELHGELPTSDEILKSFRPSKNSIITVGSQGAIFVDSEGTIVRCAAPQTTPVDTTGAGDSFVGSFAFALSQGHDPVRAMEFGVKVASNSVTKKGAQSSYPNQAEIKTLS